jgi:hypothetical protein
VEIDSVDPMMDDAVIVDPVSVEKFALLVFSVETLIVDAVRVDPVSVEKFVALVFNVETLIVDAVKLDPVNVEIAIALVFKVDTLMVELKICTLRFAKNDMASLLEWDKDKSGETHGYVGIRSEYVGMRSNT